MAMRPPEAVSAVRPRPARSRSSLPSAPTAGRWRSPRCRRRNSRKPLRRSWRRTCAARKSRSRPRSRPARIVVDTPNTYLYYVLGNGRAIRYGVRVGRDGFTWTGVQKITRKAEWPDWHPPSGDDRAPALSAALHGRRPRQSARRPRDVSRLDRLPHPRHQPALDDRQVRLLGLHRHAERGRLGPVRSRQGRHPRRGDAGRPAAGNGDRIGRAVPGRIRRAAQAGPVPARSRRWCRRCPRRSRCAKRVQRIDCKVRAKGAPLSA